MHASSVYPSLTTTPVAHVDVWQNIKDNTYLAAITLEQTASDQQISTLREGLREAEFTIPTPPQDMPRYELTKVSVQVSGIRDLKYFMQTLEKLGMKPSDRCVHIIGSLS